jgi:uncharacterized protein
MTVTSLSSPSSRSSARSSLEPSPLPPMLITGPSRPRVTLVLAHGAGAPMDAPFLRHVAEGLAAHRVRVVRFAFPYMEKRLLTGVKRPPDRLPVLLEAFERVVQSQKGPVAIGGKSMGGRVASHLADAIGAAAFVALGYPFCPPGRGKAPPRAFEHLETMSTKGLVVQGTRDPFGDEAWGKRSLGKITPQVKWIDDGNHDFVPGARNKRSATACWDEVVAAAATFLTGEVGDKPTRALAHAR